MIHSRIVDLVKHQPERLTANWCARIKRSQVTSSYHRLSEADLAARHSRVFQHLSNWLEHSMTRDELSRFFLQIGKERHAERVPLCQVSYALSIAKRNLWELVQSQGLLDSSLEFYQAMELMSSIDQFFDLGSFYVVRGYLDAMAASLRESGRLSEKELREVLFRSDPHSHPEIREHVKNE